MLPLLLCPSTSHYFALISIYLGRKISNIYQALIMTLPFIVSEPLKRRNFLKFMQLTHMIASLFNQSLLLRLWALPSSGLCPPISTANRSRLTRFYFLGLASRFRASLTAGLLRVDQGLPGGHGSRCLFNFCPQHFNIISQGLDWGQKNMNIFRCTVTPILSSPPHLEDR